MYLLQQALCQYKQQAYCSVTVSWQHSVSVMCLLITVGLFWAEGKAATCSVSHWGVQSFSRADWIWDGQTVLKWADTLMMTQCCSHSETPSQTGALMSHYCKIRGLFVFYFLKKILFCFDSAYLSFCQLLIHVKLSLDFTRMYFAHCFFTWMFHPHCAEWCMCGVSH